MQDPYYSLGDESDDISNPDALRRAGDAVTKIAKNVNAFLPGVFGVIASPFVLVGHSMKALDSFMKGKLNRSGKELMRGAVESGTSFVADAGLWPANIASVIITGKHLSTHAGEVFGGVVDGANRAKQANLAGVSVMPPMQQAMYAPPTGTAYMDPAMIQPTQPQPAYAEAMPAPGRAPMHWRDTVAQQQGVDPKEKWQQYNRDGGEGAEHVAALESAREQQPQAEAAR